MRGETEKYNLPMAQEDLRTSEIRYRRLFESARDGILILNAMTGKITDANPFMVELLGYSRNDFLGKELWEIGLLKDEETSKNAFRELQEKGYIRYEDLPLETKAGARRLVEFVSNVYEESDSQVIQCNIRDITERRLAEDESKRFFALSVDILCVAGQDGYFKKVNPAFPKILGYTEQEILAVPYLDLIHPEEVAATITQVEKLKEGGVPIINFENRYRCRDGSYRWLKWMGAPFTDDGLLYASARDITESKRLEDELRRNEASLANAQRIAHLGNWDWDIENDRLFWSDEVYQIFGISKTQFGASYESFVDGIHPADRPLVQSAVDAALSGTAPYNAEHRIFNQIGVEKIVCELGEVTFDDSGKPLRMTGTVQDITERKRAEETLKASEAKQRQLSERQSAILDALPAHICLVCGIGNILAVNDTWRQYALINNFSGDNFGIGSNYLEVCESVTGDYSIIAQQTAEGIKSVLSGESNHFELEYPCHSPAEKAWFRVTVTPLQKDSSEGVVVMHINVTERKQSEEALRKAEAGYRNLVELSPAIVYLAKPFPPYQPIYISPNIIKFGYQPEEWFERNDMWISLLHEEDRERVLQMIGEAMSQNLDTDLEYRIVAKDDSVHWVHDKGCFVSDERGNKIGWQGVIVDTTETKLLEEQLRQSQKLESVGRLAGGIAHDFNNMLTVINGYSELTLRRLKADDPLRRNIEEIKKAGDRSAELTHQLLAFSRRQVLKPKLVNLNTVIDETGNMLQRLLGENIQFISVINPKLGFVMADFGQLSQIILNLTVNARDAMPEGGKLTIETANVFLDSTYTNRHSGVLPGAYVMLAVSDTGKGIDAETQKHIFEPFFTTKGVGLGTGLGLATVYGIVKQSGGNINLYSEEGVGTTFKIYLPRVAGQADVVEIESNKELLMATGTILLVEDEDIVRTLAKQVLEECGYTVIEARNGLEALSICNAGDCEFDLLMTDVVMPQMGGRELADTLKEKLPDLQVLFTSGYTDDAVIRHGVIEVGTNFIQKPFTPNLLAQKVRELL